jgi:hypothetical protein
VSLVSVSNGEGDVRYRIVGEHHGTAGKTNPVKPHPEPWRSTGGGRDSSPESPFARAQSRAASRDIVQRAEEVLDDAVAGLEPSLGRVDHVLGCSVRVLDD